MRKEKLPPLPVPGDTKQMQWLLRDIKMGWKESDPKGKLFCGWCSITDTFQLWQMKTQGKEAIAEFVGFIRGKAE